MPKMKQDGVVRFEAINASDSYCNREAFRRLLDFYSWDAESWFQTPTGKKSKTYKKCPFIEDVDNRGFYWFPTGMVPGMVDLCIKHKIPAECPNMGFTVNSTFPEEDGLNIKFRPNQIAAIKSAVQKGRGVIHASTGSGKTGVAFGIFQAYLQQDPKIQCLFLAHTVDLVHQAAKEFIEFGEKSVGIIQGQIRGEGRIICSTIQTMDKLGPEYYQNRFTVAIVDECFHKDTPVRMAQGTKKISEICVGDMVQTSTGQKKVTNVFQTKVPLHRVCKVNLSNGKSIFCSVDHVFKTPSGEIKASDLTGKEINVYESIMRALRKKRRKRKVQ